MSLVQFALARFDAFINRIQGFQPTIGRVQSYRREPFQSATKRPRPVALFGASPDGFALDYVTYRSPKTMGAGTQPLAPELKNIDADSNLERWVPDPSVPSLISHGRALNYSHESDQRPVLSFRGETSDVWDGIVRSSEPKKSLETSRRSHDKTEGDRQAEDLKRYPFDFSV